MGRIKINDSETGGENRRKDLWRVLHDVLHCKINKIIDGRNFFIIVASDEWIEKISKQEAKECLREANFSVTTPREIISRRTVVVKGVDIIVSDFSETEIKEEIERQQDWAKVEEVIKFPTTRKILKIRFQDVESAKMALEKGLEIFGFYHEKHQLEQELCINLKPCYNCYEYSHLTRNCNKGELKWCSECAARDHKYTDCLSLTKKCLNCGENHRTLASACKERKKILKLKEKEIREKSKARKAEPYNVCATKTFYTSHLTNTATEEGDISGLSITTPVVSKIVTCLFHSYVMNVIKPGTFHYHIKQMYELNGLGSINFPEEDIDTTNVLKLATQGVFDVKIKDLEAKRELRRTETINKMLGIHTDQRRVHIESVRNLTVKSKVPCEIPQKPPRKLRDPARDLRRLSHPPLLPNRKTVMLNPSLSMEDKLPVAPPPSPEEVAKIKPHTIGLQLFRPKDTEFANTIRPSNVYKLIQENKIKWGYRASNLTPEEVFRGLVSGRIELKPEMIKPLPLQVFNEFKQGSLFQGKCFTNGK